MTATLETPEALAVPAARQRHWEPAAVVVLLGATALLYLWDLSASGWANSFYAAAVQAGSSSWKAMLFGSSDAAGAITVDKPPASLWVMDLSARVFGLNAWSLLVPQALEGVASVWLLHLSVRRVASPAAGLLAGLVLATTPVAALMFRFDNPDSLLVLALVAAAYATTRALEAASARWLALAGALVGLGFLTKMLQAVLVVPVLAGVYLLAAPTGLGARVRHLLVAGAAMVAAAGWWIALVSLWPAGSRPWIGGSQTNSVLELTLGYNGFGRLTGNETGSVGGGGRAGSRWGTTGLLRMFGSEFAGGISWLLPAALVLLAGSLWLTWRGPRVDRLRAAVLLWGGWLVVTGLVLSLAHGIIHPYYAVALAPAVGAAVGLGTTGLWQRRDRLVARGLLAAALLATSLWTFRLLLRTPAWHASLRPVLLLAALAAAAALLWLPLLRDRAVPAVAAVALLTSLTTPALASVATASVPHSGAIPSVAPSSGRGPGGFGGPPRGGRAPGGIGSLLDASPPSAELVAALRAGASSYTWVAAAVGSNAAAGPQLATGLPVMAIGGFNGTD
ncbi:MAG: ArnT family glycosyltransferase, partial [Mycobacteriales bacterium]